MDDMYQRPDDNKMDDLYTLMAPFVGVVGTLMVLFNVATVITIVTSKSMRTPTGILMVGLSSTDTLFGVLAILYTSVYALMPSPQITQTRLWNVTNDNATTVSNVTGVNLDWTSSVSDRNIITYANPHWASSVSDWNIKTVANPHWASSVSDSSTIIETNYHSATSDWKITTDNPGRTSSTTTPNITTDNPGRTSSITTPNITTDNPGRASSTRLNITTDNLGRASFTETTTDSLDWASYKLSNQSTNSSMYNTTDKDMSSVSSVTTDSTGSVWNSDVVSGVYSSLKNTSETYSDVTTDSTGSGWNSDVASGVYTIFKNTSKTYSDVTTDHMSTSSADLKAEGEVEHAAMASHFLGPLCALLPFLFVTTLLASSLISVLVAVDRYLFIVKPYSYQRYVNKTRLSLAVVLCWLGSFLGLSLQLLLSDYHRMKITCQFLVGDEGLFREFPIAQLVCLVVSGVLYGLITRVAVKHRSAISRLTPRSPMEDPAELKQLERKLRVYRMFFLVYGTYFLCVCPIVVVRVVQVYVSAAVLRFVFGLFMLNSILNTPIFIVMHRPFRAAFKRRFCAGCRRGHATVVVAPNFRSLTSAEQRTADDVSLRLAAVLQNGVERSQDVTVSSGANGGADDVSLGLSVLHNGIERTQDVTDDVTSGRTTDAQDGADDVSLRLSAVRQNGIERTHDVTDDVSSGRIRDANDDTYDVSLRRMAAADALEGASDVSLGLAVVVQSGTDDVSFVQSINVRL